MATLVRTASNGDGAALTDSRQALFCLLRSRIGSDKRRRLKWLRRRTPWRVGPADVVVDDQDPRDFRRLAARSDVYITMHALRYPNSGLWADF